MSGARCLVSVLIPTYNRRSSLGKALAALNLQTLPARDYEVIVCIDGSQDGTRELVESYRPRYSLRFVWQSNQGRATARNAGIRIAHGELLVFIDDDMSPVPEFLEAHVRAHAAGERLGVLGPVPIEVTTCSTSTVRYIGAKFNAHLRKLADPAYEIKLRDFYSGNFSIRSDVLFQVGLFDEEFKAYGNEDIELYFRLIAANVSLLYCQEAVAHQEYSKDFADLARDTVAKGHTAVLLARKHPGSFGSLQLASYYRGARTRRLLRSCLLTLSDLWGWIPVGLINCAAWISEHDQARSDIYYGLILDYCYWLGAVLTLKNQWPIGVGQRRTSQHDIRAG